MARSFVLACLLFVAPASAVAPKGFLPPEQPAELGAGDSHTCAVLGDGTMKCWGRQEQNQLAAGSYFFASGHPTDVVGIADALKVDGGYQFTCVLLEDGRIKCFGYHRFGQLGTGPTGCPFEGGAADCALVVGIDDAIDVAAGGSHACAVRADGSVACWGLNVHGALGIGTTEGQSDVPVPVGGVAGAFAVAAGGQHSCALVGVGSVMCWGRDQLGQLGRGSATADPGSGTAAPVAGITDAVAIAAGESHTCVLHASGNVSCWGHEDHGALGNGEDDDPAQFLASPRSIGFNDAQAIALGARHTCVQRSLGVLTCFGDNYFGQVGNGGNRDNRVAPTTVAGVSNVSAVAAGDNHTCARVSRDPVNVMCWGSGNLGQIGNGTTGGVNETPSPVHVVGAPFHTIFGGDAGSFEPVF